MLRLGTVVIGAEEVERAVAFWSELLTLEVVRFEADPAFVILRPPSGVGTRLAIQPSDEPAADHPRIHVDLLVDSADEQRAAVTRVVTLGGERIDWDRYDPDPDYVVVADTEGNRFCVVDTSHG